MSDLLSLAADNAAPIVTASMDLSKGRIEISKPRSHDHYCQPMYADRR